MSASAPPKAPSLAAALPPSRLPASQRIIAIGDVHGDLQATRKALALGGLIDAADQWVGGRTTLVQTGDILDRGDDEQAIIDLFERLAVQAKEARGAVYVLNGNHELMNAMGDFRYVTAGGFVDFSDAPGVSLDNPLLSRLPAKAKYRAAALLPGGAYARKLARHAVVLMVGDNVFVHGGVAPQHARYGIERINREASEWLSGGNPVGRKLVTEPQSVVWMRHYSDRPDSGDCALLAETLTILKAKRMVVGHTPQQQLRSECDERVWLIDTGMARAYPGEPSALEIIGDKVRPLH